MIILSAGHYPESRGACYPENNPHWCEYDEAEDWVNHIAILLRQRIKVGIVPTGPLTRKVVWINNECKRNDVKLAIEIHFNSDASKQQHGSETLYCPGSARGELMANIVQGAVGAVLKPDRGVKPGWFRMVRPPDPRAVPDYFLKYTRCPALIIEPEFIYNREVLEFKRDLVCDVIADALVEAATNA